MSAIPNRCQKAEEFERYTQEIFSHALRVKKGQLFISNKRGDDSQFKNKEIQTACQQFFQNNVEFLRDLSLDSLSQWQRLKNSEVSKSLCQETLARIQGVVSFITSDCRRAPEVLAQAEKVEHHDVKILSSDLGEVLAHRDVLYLNDVFKQKLTGMQHEHELGSIVELSLENLDFATAAVIGQFLHYQYTQDLPKEGSLDSLYRFAQHFEDITLMKDILLASIQSQGKQLTPFLLQKLASEEAKFSPVEKKILDKFLFRDQLVWGGVVDGDLVKELRKLDAEGKAIASVFLGHVYEHGFGVKQDQKQAFAFYNKAADKGNAVGQVLAGACYYSAIGVEKNLDRAFDLFNRAAAQGHPVGQRHVGDFYTRGIVVAENEKTAVQYFKLAADQGEAVAQRRLGNYYFKPGPNSNAKLAFHYYQLAADQGDVESQVWLAFAYEEGIAVSKDNRRAFDYYQLAANQGNAKAQCNLGRCYEQGIGTTLSKHKAFNWYQKAAGQGIAEAQYQMGEFYQYGIFGTISPSLKEALSWYQKAVKQGHPQAKEAVKKIHKLLKWPSPPS